MSPSDVKTQLEQAVLALLLAGSEMPRHIADRVLREAGLEVGVPAMLRRGLVYQNMNIVVVTRKAKARPA